jgi:hypothetical protein
MKPKGLNRARFRKRRPRLGPPLDFAGFSAELWRLYVSREKAMREAFFSALRDPSA